jgi:hypothetical protein
MTKLPPVLSEAMIAIVSRALNSPRGISIAFPSEGAAINWRQRYYTIRKGVVKADPASEWRTLTCVVHEAEPGKFHILLVPSDEQVLQYDITEL